jgi:hypothetical protein
MLAQPLPFPPTSPYPDPPDPAEPLYDARRHLALEPPARVRRLEDLGYGRETIAGCASAIAITSPFRILSDEGVRALQGVTRALKARRSRIDGNRVPEHLAGGVYRSRFLRDFCHCPIVAGFLSELAGTPLAPHSMPSQQVYVNYEPADINRSVDAWHFDGVGFDYVLMVSDPTGIEGGRFEYFEGTREQAAEILGTSVAGLPFGHGGELPAERIVGADFPAAGYGIFQQGNLVVHRASRLFSAGERITLVPAYVSCDLAYPDPTNTVRMPNYGEPGILTELLRHAAWLGAAKLDALTRTMPFSEDPRAVAAALRRAVADVQRVADQIEASAEPKD